MDLLPSLASLGSPVDPPLVSGSHDSAAINPKELFP